MSTLKKENLAQYKADYTKNIEKLRELQKEAMTLRSKVHKLSSTESYGMVERLKLYIGHNQMDQKHVIEILDLLNNLILICRDE